MSWLVQEVTLLKTQMGGIQEWRKGVEARFDSIDSRVAGVDAHLTRQDATHADDMVTIIASVEKVSSSQERMLREQATMLRDQAPINAFALGMMADVQEHQMWVASLWGGLQDTVEGATAASIAFCFVLCGFAVQYFLTHPHDPGPSVGAVVIALCVFVGVAYGYARRRLRRAATLLASPPATREAEKEIVP